MNSLWCEPEEEHLEKREFRQWGQSEPSTFNDPCRNLGVFNPSCLFQDTGRRFRGRGGSPSLSERRFASLAGPRRRAS